MSPGLPSPSMEARPVFQNTRGPVAGYARGGHTDERRAGPSFAVNHRLSTRSPLLLRLRLYLCLFAFDVPTSTLAVKVHGAAVVHVRPLASWAQTEPRSLDRTYSSTPWWTESSNEQRARAGFPSVSSIPTRIAKLNAQYKPGQKEAMLPNRTLEAEAVPSNEARREERSRKAVYFGQMDWEFCRESSRPVHGTKHQLHQNTVIILARVMRLTPRYITRAITPMRDPLGGRKPHNLQPPKTGLILRDWADARWRGTLGQLARAPSGKATTTPLLQPTPAERGRPLSKVAVERGDA
ncbi:uncharacterized protein N7482_004685 [Penicillium canariense]|uniref:Uncharacterized protein n=1 Tax=Penicillium canariense TaxID=189055 RepID=A0A9W9LQB6_9EURO|nr:uncharacterized protein N7482_004685 [Penicillium canariense]KAJ5169091.1 hypothetical protein N7482_004685 [Penicillium canariense]